MDGGPIPALHDMRPIVIVAPPACNFCGADSWNKNSPPWCGHDDDELGKFAHLRTGPRATEHWVCVMCDKQSSNWSTMVDHLYRTGHGFVSTDQNEP